MKKSLLLACVVALAAGCAPAATESNQPPTAYVPAVTPEISSGQSIELSGYGTDVDGEVVGYRWRSSLDGELSRTAVFVTDSLSAGNHVLYFSVQDDDGAWSAEVQQSVRVTAPPAVPPEIAAFNASRRSIRVGENVTLSWSVAGAETIVVDHGFGAVPASGSLVVSPSTTTTYVLTAAAGGAVATAGVTVEVDQGQVMVLTPEADVSGYVRRSGYGPYGEIYVGDDEADRGLRGFLTYRISKIPDDAVIVKVTVDLSGYEMPYDQPFPHLGCLSAFEHPYNTLQGQYMMPGVSGVLEQWCEVAELDAPKESPGLREALQQKVGESRLQLRLQFADMESDGDQARDILRWRGHALPTLIVNYYSGESSG